MLCWWGSVEVGASSTGSSSHQWASWSALSMGSTRGTWLVQQWYIGAMRNILFSWLIEKLVSIELPELPHHRGTSIHSLLSPKCVHSVWCNYPGSSTAAGMWTLHATAGSNIQLHFLDFDTEATHDMVEVRDGAGPNSSLLGEDVIYTQSYYHFLLLLSENFIQLCFIFSYPYWKQWPRPWLVLNNQSDDSLVLDRCLRSRQRIQS